MFGCVGTWSRNRRAGNLPRSKSTNKIYTHNRWWWRGYKCHSREHRHKRMLRTSINSLVLMGYYIAKLVPFNSGSWCNIRQGSCRNTVYVNCLCTDSRGDVLYWKFLSSIWCLKGRSGIGVWEIWIRILVYWSGWSNHSIENKVKLSFMI